MSAVFGIILLMNHCMNANPYTSIESCFKDFKDFSAHYCYVLNKCSSDV